MVNIVEYVYRKYGDEEADFSKYPFVIKKEIEKVIESHIITYSDWKDHMMDLFNIDEGSPVETHINWMDWLCDIDAEGTVYAFLDGVRLCDDDNGVPDDTFRNRTSLRICEVDYIQDDLWTLNRENEEEHTKKKESMKGISEELKAKVDIRKKEIERNISAFASVIHENNRLKKQVVDLLEGQKIMCERILQLESTGEPKKKD
jgi:hypothetical protein